MSFSVSASDGPSAGHSPGLQPAYVSPHLGPHGGPDDGGGGAKRGGIDPTKYKTTICRNWESGSCTFRGCTFAHGVDELRAPLREVAGAVPHVSPTGTPLMLPQSSAVAPAGGGPARLEQLVEALMAEVSRQRDLMQSHRDANRTLEGMLRAERKQHEQTFAQLQELQVAYAQLHATVSECQEELQRRAAQGPPPPGLQALRQNFGMLPPAQTGSDDGVGRSSDDGIDQLLQDLISTDE